MANRNSDFFDAIKRFAEETPQEIAEESAKITRDIFSTVIDYSPVDTGRFVANWQIETEVFNMSVVGTSTKSEKVAEINKKVTKDYFLTNSHIYMYNSVLYAFKVEYNGWNPPTPKHLPYAPIAQTIGKFSGGV